MEQPFHENADMDSSALPDRFANLPGAEIVEPGLRDLAAERETLEAYLVSMARPRLLDLGLAVSAPIDEPELKLYRLLGERYEDGAHSKYNAYRRRLVSFLKCAARLIHQEAPRA